MFVVWPVQREQQEQQQQRSGVSVPGWGGCCGNANQLVGMGECQNVKRWRMEIFEKESRVTSLVDTETSFSCCGGKSTVSWVSAICSLLFAFRFVHSPPHRYLRVQPLI